MGAATGRATRGSEEVGTGIDSQCPQRGAFNVVGGRVCPRGVGLFLVYVECMAGLIILVTSRDNDSVVFFFAAADGAYSRLRPQPYLHRSSRC